MSEQLFDLKTYEDWQDLLLHEPIVHNHMVGYMKYKLNYIETLKSIILDLANYKAYLMKQLEHEIASSVSPSPFIRKP